MTLVEALACGTPVVTVTARTPGDRDEAAVLVEERAEAAGQRHRRVLTTTRSGRTFPGAASSGDGATVERHGA